MKSFLLFAVFTASALFTQSPAEKTFSLGFDAQASPTVIAQIPLLYRAQKSDVLQADKTPKVQKPPKEKAAAPQKTSAAPVPSPGVIPALTFSEYQLAPIESSPHFEVRTFSEPRQAPFRVSVVGININAWLENPDNYSALEEAAKDFPIQDLLRNIAQYSPALKFNTPSLVQSLLTQNIYSPYFSHSTNSPKMPPLFSQRMGVVSFTRNYHIYGAAAGGLPYFGVPAEGADRRIILASVKDQLLEYSARLPDTDIFLVVTVNITPNWLEEGWDVRQVNRQNAEIIIHAFNRRGRLIGGAGVPKNFMSKGSFITFSQTLESKVWQPSVSRAFYIWPSFKIINTPMPGSQKQSPAATLPPSARPYLNRTQKYIVKALENIRALGLPPQTPLFDSEGKPIYNMQKTPPAPRVLLAKRGIYLTNSPVQTNPPLNYSPRALAELEGSAKLEAFNASSANIASYKEKEQAKKSAKAEKEAEKARIKEEKKAERAKKKAEEALSQAFPSTPPATYVMPLLRAQNMRAKQQPPASDIQEKIAENRNKKDAKERISISEGYRLRKYQPSNEKEKLQSLMNGVSETLKQAPFYTTNNVLAISNHITPFETESDPIAYFSERKKYYSVRASVRLFARQFKKDTALFQKALNARMEDEIFWTALYRKAIRDNQLWTPPMEEAYTNHQEQLRLRQRMELARFKYNRNSELIQGLISNVAVFGQREIEYLKIKIKNPEKLAQKAVWNQNNMAKALSRYSAKFFEEPYLQQKAQFEAEYLAASQGFDKSYSAYEALLPKGFRVAFLNSASPKPEQLVKQNNPLWAGLAERNRVPIELIAYVESNNFLYPSKIFRIALQRRAMRSYKKDMRFITFEGFALGLSGSWKAKTFTADRLTDL